MLFSKHGPKIVVKNVKFRHNEIQILQLVLTEINVNYILAKIGASLN